MFTVQTRYFMSNTPWYVIVLLLFPWVFQHVTLAISLLEYVAFRPIRRHNACTKYEFWRFSIHMYRNADNSCSFLDDIQS
mgnify:CR=1 FL=1